MKRILKRVFATVCFIFILSALALPCFAATNSCNFTISAFSSWSSDQQAALSQLVFYPADMSGSGYSYSQINGQTISFVSDYYEGYESVFVVYNYSYYTIKLGVAKVNPWSWLTNITIPAANGSTPGVAYLKRSDISNYTGAINIYTDSSLAPTYVGPGEYNAEIVYYKSDNSTFISAEFVTIAPSDIVNGYYTVPALEGYEVVPSRIYVGSVPSSSVQFKVFALDIGSVATDSYNKGYNKGFNDGISSVDITSATQDAYDRGVSAGLSQNSLTAEQIRELRSDYNVFTGFFDGIFNGLISTYNYVTGSIAFGGITLNMVITTFIVIIVVIFFASLIIKNL